MSRADRVWTTIRRLTRAQLLAGSAALGWLAVSLLPWWQVRYAVGNGTAVSSGSVWRASTLGSLAVLVAAGAVPLLLLAGRGGRWRRAAPAGLAWAAVVLLLITAWSVDTVIDGTSHFSFTLSDADFQPAIGYTPVGTIVRDRLSVITGPLGYSEGFGWGSGAGLAAAVGQALVLTFAGRPRKA